MVNKRAVPIPLECILVLNNIFFELINLTNEMHLSTVLAMATENLPLCNSIQDQFRRLNFLMNICFVVDVNATRYVHGKVSFL